MPNRQVLLQDQGTEIKITDSAIDWIAKARFDTLYGAKPIKRLMQKHILNKLSKEILAGSIDRAKTITIDYFDGNDLTFR